MPQVAVLDFEESRMVALAEAVEVLLGGVALQAAVVHEGADGSVAQGHALAQGFVHRLLVVHLAVANWCAAFAESLLVVAGLLGEILGGGEVDSGIDDVFSRDGFGVGVLANEP